MAKIMWCLGHEENEIVYFDTESTFHIDWDNGWTCQGPFYTSAPPELEEYWPDELVEPSVEELEEMDAGAELLLWDLGLAEK